MENASLYTSANSLQRKEARNVLQEFLSILPLKKGSRVLDIGCGSGDVTSEILIPLLPKDVEDVIGIDISFKMITYAQETYGSARLSFSQMDIAEEVEDLFEKIIINNNNNPKLENSVKELETNVEILINGIKLNELKEEDEENACDKYTSCSINRNEDYENNKILNNDQRFNVVFSFFCLHWIQNQRQAFTNILGLLKGGGETLLVLLANSSIFTLYQRLADIPKWAPYMTDVDRFISPYYFSEDPAKDFSELVTSVGFEAVSIECRESIFVYPNADTLKDAIKAVSPFYPRLQENQRATFLSDCLSIVNEYNLAEKESNGLQVSYKLIVAHLRKPSIKS